MSVLVTGGSGFLGTNLTLKLRQRESNVISLSSADADLCRQDSLDRFSDQKLDRIYHLAAWIQGGDFSLKHPGEQWLVNQQINTTVLNWWARHQPQARLIAIGTSGAYSEGLDLCEDHYLTGSPFSDLYTYGMTKRMLHIGLKSLAAQYGLSFLTVVPSTLYGPNYRVDHRRRQFIFDLAAKILKHKHFGDEIVLWGDGHQRRELVYVDDFVNDLLLLENKVENDIVNIGAGTHHSIREFADLLCHQLDVSPDIIRYDETGYVGAKAKYISTEKESRILGELVRTPLDVGLSSMLETFAPQFLEYESRSRGESSAKSSSENQVKDPNPESDGPSAGQSDDRFVILQEPVSILMPVYNESSIIEAVVEEWYREVMAFLPEGSELLFDDASDDQTTVILESLRTKHPYIRINHAKRDGFGNATKRLYRMASNPLVFFTDSDGQYSPSDFWKIAEAMGGNSDDGYDMLNGYKTGRKHPLYQIIGSVAFNLFVRILFSSNGRDINSAFKLIRRGLVEDQVPKLCHVPNFINSELYIRAEKAGYKIKDIPVAHRARFEGKSKVSTPITYLKNGITTIRGMWNLKSDLSNRP